MINFFTPSINDTLTMFNEEISTNSCTNEVKIQNCRKFIKLKKLDNKGYLSFN